MTSYFASDPNHMMVLCATMSIDGSAWVGPVVAGETSSKYQMARVSQRTILETDIITSIFLFKPASQVRIWSTSGCFMVEQGNHLMV